MAIYGVGGKPGSGKTYWVVNHLVTKYFTFDKVLEEFIPKTSITIITNVEELRLEHFRLDDMIEKAGGSEKFFTVEYQKELLKRFNKIVYVIDEAGQPRYFPVNLKNDKVTFLMQYHRHLGLDFYLVAPGVSNICPQIVRLMEYRIQARARSKSFMRDFSYQKIVEGDQAGRQTLIWKKEIFRLYRSMEIEESEKVGSVTRKYVLMTVVFIGVAITLGYLSLSYVFFGGVKKANEKLKEKNQMIADKKAGVVAEETKTPPLKQQDSVASIKGSASGSLAEQGVNDSPNGDDDTSVFDLERVRLIKLDGGEIVVYTESGFIIDNDLLGIVLKNAVVRNGKVFIKKRTVQATHSGARSPERGPGVGFASGRDGAGPGK